jgi:hypothetical protein
MSSPSPGPQRVGRRRAHWAALAVVVGLVVGGCAGDDGAAPPTTPVPTTSTTTTTSPPSTTTTITPDPARKVLILGDSGMVDASPALDAMFRATGAEVVNAAVPGFGLTRLGVRGDPSPFRSMWTQLVAEEQPDLSVVMLGVWDGDFVTTNGSAAYADVVDEAMAILTAAGGRVLLISPPPGPEGDEHNTDVAFEVVAATYPGQVFYLDIEAAELGPDGGYPSSYVALDGSVVRLRKADGWHFCPEGAERLATEVNRLAVVHGLTVPATGWEDGAWRGSDLYDEPACLG